MHVAIALEDRMLKSWMFALVLATGLALPGAAISGPTADFEAALGVAYADYRAALFQTNRKDKAATNVALGRFLKNWRQLIAEWSKNPPPHMAEDGDFARSLASVESIALQAEEEVVEENLPKAHETLEAIRDEISVLRERNGLVSFSDRMNSYHERMELVLERPIDRLDAEAIGIFREDAAVLSYLAESIARYAPSTLRNDPKFTAALQALKESVKALIGATRAGDPASTKKALQELKAPYSRMFLNFG